MKLASEYPNLNQTDYHNAVTIDNLIQSNPVFLNNIPILYNSGYGFTYSWKWVAIHVISINKVTPNQLLFRVQFFNSLSLCENMYIVKSFQDAHSAIDYCANCFLESENRL